MDNYAILIPSCDKFSFFWKPFFAQLFKNWPDCSYTVYLGSNKKGYIDKRVKNILTGKDYGWAKSFKIILEQIPEKYLFVWPEDAFIISRIDKGQFDYVFRLMSQLKIKHIHYRCRPDAERYTENNFLGIYPKGMPYRVNMAGFWDREYLMGILINGENSWNFEIMGSYRVSNDDGFYCLNFPLFEFIHLSEKHKLKRESVKKAQQLGISVDDFGTRQSLNEYYISKLKAAYFDFVINKNWQLRVKLMDVLRKILISY